MNAVRPEVSVLVTTHAVDPILFRHALASVLGQTLANIEVIVVLDGDIGAAEAELSAVSHDPRVRVLRPGKVGRGVALNLALSSARADLVAIQDSDDESHPMRLELQCGVLEEHPEIDLLGAIAVPVVDPAEHADWALSTRSGTVKTLDRQLLTRNVLIHTSVMARSALFDRIGGYDAQRSRYFDYDLYLRAREAGAHLALLDTPLVLHRVHPQQAFGSERNLRRQMKDSYRLQFRHARREPVVVRWWYGAGIVFRVPLRHARSQFRLRRVRGARPPRRERGT